MKRKNIAFALGIITSCLLSVGVAQAAGSLSVDSLRVGSQGVGGVTYFNGTIVNNTTTNNLDNPVTFGDNVRIDGRVYRGSVAGTSDSKPFIINDNVQVDGYMTVMNGVYGSPASHLFMIQDGAQVSKSLTVNESLSVKGTINGKMDRLPLGTVVVVSHGEAAPGPETVEFSTRDGGYLSVRFDGYQDVTKYPMFTLQKFTNAGVLFQEFSQIVTPTDITSKVIILQQDASTEAVVMVVPENMEVWN